MGSMSYCWWKFKPLWKTVCQHIIRLKIFIPVTPAISSLGIHPGDGVASVQRGMFRNVHLALLIRAQIWAVMKKL